MSPRLEAASITPLDSVSAARTAEQRRGKSVWDITLIRGADTTNRNTTINELRAKIHKEGLRRGIRAAELEFAKATATPPPSPEEPDPDWVDIVAVAQSAIDTVEALVEDLNYLLGLLERGGE